MNALESKLNPCTMAIGGPPITVYVPSHWPEQTAARRTAHLPGVKLYAGPEALHSENGSKRSPRFIWRWRIARLRRLHAAFEGSGPWTGNKSWRANQLCCLLQRSGFLED